MTDHATARPTGGARPRHNTGLDEAAGGLFAHCLSAFHAFRALPELSEDLRILSLNAELAAGRAGAAGVAVRALTQYTRQLVNQLNRLQAEMEALKARTHGMSARTMRDLHHLRLVRRARACCAGPAPADGDTADAAHAGALRRLTEAEADMAAKAGGLMNEMMAAADTLGRTATRIRQVAAQSSGIATNIAIEAAAAGRHEPEFSTVARTMKRYIETLQSMVEHADRAVHQAGDAGQALSERLAAGHAPRS